MISPQQDWFKRIPQAEQALRLFSDYLLVTGVAHIEPESGGDPALIGTRLGLVNGSAWITLWANYFGRLFCPGAHLVNVGNEALQMNFMQAHQQGKPVPPKSNIDLFVSYARDLVELAQVDAILITCSTMNRAFPAVAEAMQPYGVPVLQIDRPMMEAAVKHGGRILVVATHGPTVESTQALLRQTAADLGTEVAYSGLEVEEAWQKLAAGDIVGHNRVLAEAIRAKTTIEHIDCVVLAQLSMTVFLLSYPHPQAELGIPVFTSGKCGFEQAAELLRNG